MHKSSSTGFNVLPVNLSLLNSLVAATVDRVNYDLNSKPRSGAKPGSFATSDCSGYLHWLLPQVITEHCDFPDGSAVQHEWCAKQGLKMSSYKDSAAQKDFRLRIAFIAPKGKHVGHVWLVLNGKTIECYGGHGVGRRMWNEPVLEKNVSACYVLSDPMV